MKDWKPEIDFDGEIDDENEINLFEIAEKNEKFDAEEAPDSTELSEQIDLFEYAEQYEDTPKLDRPENIHLNPNEKPKKRKRSNWFIVFTSLLLVFSVLTVGTIGLFLYYYNKLDYDTEDTQLYEENTEAMSASYVTNILLIGTDERTSEFSTDARSDCMMILSVNNRTHTVSLISLERGMTVSYRKSDNEYSNTLLTHVFKYGGASLLLDTVERTFDIDIDRYVRVNFNTFEQIIDKLGGVDIELSAEEVRGLNTEKHQGQVVDRKLSVGVNHLNGSEALLYARLRWIDSDFKRVERQRKVLIAVKEKMADASYIKIMGIANDVLPLVRTNIPAGEMAKLMLDLTSTLKNDVQQATIPVKGTYSSLGAVDFDKNAEILHQMLYGETAAEN